MNALVPATCVIPGQAAAKAALLRRIEASARANEDRPDAPAGRHGQGHAKAPDPRRALQPVSALAAHILGARHDGANATGYSAYDKAARLLALESHVLDVTLG